MSPAKTDEQIEMLFGLCTRVGPRNHALGGGPDPPPPGGEEAVVEVVLHHQKCIVTRMPKTAIYITICNIHTYIRRLASAAYGCSWF